jgi:acyl-homoserine-lactone acylase
VRLSSLILALAALPLVPLSLAQKPYTPTKGSEILWDTYGIPHLYAKSTADLFFLYGYAQAEAHGNLLLHAYGESRGRASEYFQATPASIKADTWVWTNSVPARSADWLKQQTPAFSGYLEAFAAGINAYAAKHPEALSEEAKRVLPITALDPIEHSQHFVHFTFVAGQRLAEPAITTATAATRVTAKLEEFKTDDDAGSNGWAIAPSHSASGKAMLLSNPHLAWAGNQSYFEAEFTAPGIHIYGATQVGLPVLRFAFNDNLGYTHTVNTIDAADLFRIKTTKLPDGSEGYLFDGKALAFEHETHTLKLRQADGTFAEKTLEIRRTIHGAVIKEDAGDPIALRVGGLDKPFMLEQYWQMSTAHNFAEFETALKRLQAPMYNVIYADKDGHIEYFFGGDVPRRASGDVAYWAGIVPGDTSSTLWHDYLTYAELPKVIDPPNGYVQNTNEPPWDAAWPNNLDPKNYPPYMAPTFISFRTERSLHMLSEDKKISFESMLQKKLSTRAELADRILPDLLAAAAQYGTPQAKDAAAVLARWDRLTEADSKGAVLFYAWTRQFMGPAMSIQTNFAVPYSLADPMHTPGGLKDPAKAAAMLDAAATETMHDFGALDVAWGKVMKFEINSQSNGVVTAPRGPAIDGVSLPGNGGYGNMGVFRVVTYGPLKDGIRTPVHGDGYVAAIEFTSPPHAMMSLSYGDSSQPGSKFHTNQLPLLENKTMREALLNRRAVEAHLEKKESF